MRTLTQLRERIALRERRQLLLKCLGAPASVLQLEADITESLRQQHEQRAQRMQSFFQAGVSGC